MPVSLESLKSYAEELQAKGEFRSASQVYENAYNFINQEIDNDEFQDQFQDKKLVRDIIVNLSYCYEKLNDYYKAAYFIKYAYAVFKDDPEIIYKVMKSYLLQGNLKKSVELYVKIANLSSEEESKIKLYADSKRDSYRYGSTLLKVLRDVVSLSFITEEDKSVFSNKMVEVDASLKHPKISVCMLTKNDEKTIKECLESFYKVAFELIIYDLGSTDKTKEIASNYATVVEYKFENDYSKVKNDCLKNATGDWILFVEPNDYFSKETEDEILSYLYEQEKEEPYSIYYFNNIDVNKMGNQLIFYYKPFLFRNKLGISFSRPIHEEIIHPTKELKRIYCHSLEIKTVQKQKTEEDFLESELLYRDLINKAMLNNTDSADNYYYYHFSAINYSIHGENKKALEDHYKALGLYRQKYPDKKDAFYLYILMAIIKFLADKTDNYEAMKAFIDKALNLKPNYPDALYYLGSYYEKTGDTAKAVELYQKSLEIFQDKWYRIGNPELPSIGDNIIYTLSEKFESFVW